MFGSQLQRETSYRQPSFGRSKYKSPKLVSHITNKRRLSNREELATVLVFRWTRFVRTLTKKSGQFFECPCSLVLGRVSNERPEVWSTFLVTFRVVFATRDDLCLGNLSNSGDLLSSVDLPRQSGLCKWFSLSFNDEWSYQKKIFFFEKFTSVILLKSGRKIEKKFASKRSPCDKPVVCPLPTKPTAEAAAIFDR